MYTEANKPLMEENNMSAVNQTTPTVLFNKAESPSTACIVALMHQKISLSLREYNSNIAWLTEQLEQGNLENDDIRNILTKASSPKSHESPIEKAIDSRYADPKLASLMEKTPLTLPNHIVHTAAKLLTMNQLNPKFFPQVCRAEQTDDIIPKLIGKAGFEFR